MKLANQIPFGQLNIEPVTNAHIAPVLCNAAFSFAGTATPDVLSHGQFSY